MDTGNCHLHCSEKSLFVKISSGALHPAFSFMSGVDFLPSVMRFLYFPRNAYVFLFAVINLVKYAASKCSVTFLCKVRPCSLIMLFADFVHAFIKRIRV